MIDAGTIAVLVVIVVYTYCVLARFITLLLSGPK